jgi:hypothetical protein
MVTIRRITSRSTEQIPAAMRRKSNPSASFRDGMRFLNRSIVADSTLEASKNAPSCHNDSERKPNN